MTSAAVLARRSRTPLGAHLVRDGPADDLAGEDVLDCGEVDLALTRGVLGDVGCTTTVRPSDDEPLLHQILVDGFRRPVPPFVAGADPAYPLAHQPGDAFAAAPKA